MKKLPFTLLVIYLFTSCNFMDGKDVHSDEVLFTGNGITATWYKISRITTLHDYVDITRWGHTNNVIELNTGSFYDILLDKDTVTIRTRRSPLIYRLTTISWGTYVKVDPSISTYEYMKKYRPAVAENYKDYDSIVAHMHHESHSGQ